MVMGNVRSNTWNVQSAVIPGDRSEASFSREVGPRTSDLQKTRKRFSSPPSGGIRSTIDASPENRLVTRVSGRFEN